MPEMTLANAPRFGSGIGLHRVDFLLTELKIDRRWLADTGIAVTGSNGKGSTATMCSEIARAHGLRAGLFTSPHLYRIEERIKIDGKDIEPETFARSVERVEKAVANYREFFPDETFSAFELLFAAAADIFSERNCEVCVYEAGIGGRYDPVRLVRARSAAVSSLDLEHTSLLGNSLELICYDKLDICPNNGTVYLGENCLPLAKRVDAYCALREVTPVFCGREVEILDSVVSQTGTDFLLRVPSESELEFHTPLLGRHQANNAALAVLLFRDWLRKQSKRAFSAENAQMGLVGVQWPGRLEVVREEPLTIIDVGHTPDGVRSALEGLRASRPENRFILVTGVSLDKEAEKILAILAPSFEEIVCTSAYHKGRPPEEIATIVKQSTPDRNISIAKNIEHAAMLAESMARENHIGIYVAGSMYTAIEFAQVVRGMDPKSLPHI